jgi:hypothetical protein
MTNTSDLYWAKFFGTQANGFGFTAVLGILMFVVFKSNEPVALFAFIWFVVALAFALAFTLLYMHRIHRISHCLLDEASTYLTTSLTLEGFYVGLRPKTLRRFGRGKYMVAKVIGVGEFDNNLCFVGNNLDDICQRALRSIYS